ncbi:MAG: hypothetical protein HQL20_03350 [Candidatus Omnitrophica bacterium]|nr:hypothetical protein [Candidatus Omnitrophota bacterium]
MFKKIFLTLAIIAVLASAGLYYVNKVLLPVQVKGLAIKAAEDALGRKVTFDTLQYHFLKGFVIKDLTIFSKDNPAEVFVHIDSASAQVLFPALLQQKVILPAVRVDNLSARVTRLNASTWNFTDLLTPKPGAPAAAGASAGKPLSIVISGLAVNNARIKLTDLMGGDNFSEMLEPINIKGSLDLAGSVHLTGDLNIPSTQGQMSFDIRAGMTSLNVKASLRMANIVTGKYLRFAPENVVLPVTSLNIANTTATLSFDQQGLKVAGSALFNNIAAEPVPGLKTRGALGLDKITLTLNKDEINFQGNISLQDASLEMNNGQKFNASLQASAIKFIQKGNNWTLSADADIRGINALIAEGQKIQADMVITQLSAAQTGADLNAKGNIALRYLIAEIPGITVKSAFNAPGAVLEIKQGTIDLKARPVFSALNIVLPQGLHFSGAPAVSLHFSLPPASTGEPSYDGTVQLKECSLKGAPMVGEISAIRGTVDFQTDSAALKDFSLSVLGTPVEISGTINNFSAPLLNLKASAANIDLAMIEKIIPEIIKDNGLTISGQADVQADITGQASTLDKGGLKATALLKKVNLKSAKLNQSIDNLNGTLTFNAPTLAWKDLSADFQKKTYTLNGYLEDFQNPLIATSIKAADMNIDAQVKKTDDTLALKSFNATWFDSALDASGKIFIPAGKAPTVDINATAKASLRDLPKIAPEYAKQLEALKLAGILKLTASVKGNPVDWQNLSATYNIETPALNVMGYAADNLVLEATQSNGELRPLEIKGKLYEGELGMIGNVDLVKPGFPFQSTFKLDGTNLELLKRDTPLKDQQLAGSLTVAGELKGTATNIKSLVGKTTVQITDGYLWDLEILSKVLSILSSSFPGGSVIIRDASATFNINDGKVETNNLTLKSPTLSLIGEGWLDLQDQAIDLNITPRLETPASNGTSTDLISLVNPSQGLLNIHITGTLTKPRYEHNISAPTIIKKTLQNTVGGLLKLFE